MKITVIPKVLLRTTLQTWKNSRIKTKMMMEKQTFPITRKKTAMRWKISEDHEEFHNNSIELYVVRNKLKKNLLFPINLFPHNNWPIKGNKNAQEYMIKSMKLWNQIEKI